MSLIIVEEFCFFLLGFVALIAGADMFVARAAKIARAFRVSGLAIGLTIVAFGTSLPELAISATASLKGVSAIAIGNVVGSNIANIGLIIGLVAVFKGLTLKKREFNIGVDMLLISILLALLLFRGLSGLDGFILLLLLALYVRHTLKGRTKTVYEPAKNVPKNIVFIIIGVAGVLAGSQLLVNSAVTMANLWGVSQLVISITVIAIGTSLPELVTSLTAVLKGFKEMAVGNIIGSNFFNIGAVLGVSAMIKSIPVTGRLLTLDIPAMLLFTVLLLVFMKSSDKLSRNEGMVLLAGYLIFITSQFI